MPFLRNILRRLTAFEGPDIPLNASHPFGVFVAFAFFDRFEVADSWRKPTNLWKRAPAVAHSKDAVEELLQNEVKLPGSGSSAGGQHFLQSLGELIQRDRHLPGELARLRGIGGLEGSIKVGLVKISLSGRAGGGGNGRRRRGGADAGCESTWIGHSWLARRTARWTVEAVLFVDSRVVQSVSAPCKRLIWQDFLGGWLGDLDSKSPDLFGEISSL